MAKPFAVFDIETDPFLNGRFPRAFATGFFDGKTYVQSWGKDCLRDLARWIKSFPGWVFAHNGGKFDTHYLLDYLDLTQPIRYTKINGRIAKLPFGLAEIRDSFLMLPVRLAKLDKLEIDYSKLEAANREKFKAEISRYLEFDCRSLYDKIEKFFAEFGRGLTLANRAFSQLGLLEDKPQRTSLAYDEKFREFYYGGRVQALQPGEHNGPLVYLDINSAYPFAMLSNHWFAPDYIALSELPREGIAQCLVDFDGESRGALPCRDDKTGALTFPNTVRRWKITGWEFLAGCDLGRIKPHKINVVYKPYGIRNFRRYVEHFWQQKDEATRNGDKVRREFAKLMLNAVYGKFALNPRNFTENCLCRWGFAPPQDEQGDWGPPHESNAERGFMEYQRPQKLKASPCYNVATAASITGYVRAYLLKSLCGVISPLYCDTDSVICRASGNLNLGSEIGAWKTEAILNYAAIGGKKLYACRTDAGEWKIACKGARPKPEEIIRVVKGETFHWRNDAPAFSLGTRGKLFVERKIQRTSMETVNF